MSLPIHVPGPARHPEISPPTYKHRHNGAHYGADLVGAARNLGRTSFAGSQVAEWLEAPWWHTSTGHFKGFEVKIFVDYLLSPRKRSLKRALKGVM